MGFLTNVLAESACNAVYSTTDFMAAISGTGAEITQDIADVTTHFTGSKADQDAITQADKQAPANTEDWGKLNQMQLLGYIAINAKDMTSGDSDADKAANAVCQVNIQTAQSYVSQISTASNSLTSNLNASSQGATSLIQSTQQLTSSMVNSGNNDVSTLGSSFASALQQIG